MKPVISIHLNSKRAVTYTVRQNPFSLFFLKKEYEHVQLHFLNTDGTLTLYML